MVVVEEENSCLCRCSIWASCGSKGKWGRYIALISLCNKVQHGAGGYCEFLAMDFFQVVQSSILGVVISIIIVKTPLLYSTDVKLSSVQHHSVSLTTYFNFSDSALNRSEWAITEPLSSQFGWGKRKANADQH